MQDRLVPQPTPKEMMRVNLHQAERKLIELIRAMKNGEISCIKVQNGLPVFYIIDLKDKKLI